MSSKDALRKIRDGLKVPLRHAQGGEVLTTRDVELPGPPRPMSPAEIVRLRREKIGVSQAVFATMLNSSTQTIHAWEQRRTAPGGCALRLLRTIDEKPEIGRTISGGDVFTSAGAIPGRYSTGSWPPRERGWQRRMRQRPIRAPRKAPWRVTA